MAATATGVDVDSTLAALARTLDSEQLGRELGLTTISAPRLGGDGSATGEGEDEVEALVFTSDQRYESLDELGQGGMGRVEAVWDRDLMRELALKQLHGRLAEDGLSLRQFLWEARVTAHLDHPNIVPVHDLGLDQAGRLYFTMKRVKGRSLAQLCELLDTVPAPRLAALDCEHRPTPEPDEDPLVTELGPRKRRLRAFVEICQAIAYAHDRGVLHRDLKPANVMLGEFGEVLVMDWGLATPLAGAEGALAGLMPEALRGAEDRLLGTPRYMAPELLRSEAASVRSDIYALGVMLYELLALRRPHDADSVPALVYQITEGQSTPLAEAAPELPRPLVAVVEQAMASDPSQRYASVAELIEDVEAVLDGLSPMAEQAPAVVKLHRYFTSRDNPDVAHIRLVDLDLTAIAGIALGAAGALFVLQGLTTAVFVALGLALLLFISPMRIYARALRSGHRRLERDLARRRKTESDAGE
jgi:serine/threonine protein kinase